VGVGLSPRARLRYREDTMNQFTDIYQSFAHLAATDLPIILTLVLLEGLLSADNALVLAALVKDLRPPELQRKAMKIGIWFAYIFRFIAIFFASVLLAYPVVRWGAALYLVYVGLTGMMASAEHDDAGDKAGIFGRIAGRFGLSPFWQAVVAVEFADIAFSVDSIAAALAFSDKLAVIFIGGALGILAMRFVAGWFLTLIQRFPILNKSAFLIVFVIGVKLFLLAGEFPGMFGYVWFNLNVHIPEWLGIGSTIVMFFGSIALQHYFPNSWFGKIGRAETAELKEEIEMEKDING
jgi:YkoY family integral membrane protein